jgi:hypothetical protein
VTSGRYVVFSGYSAEILLKVALKTISLTFTHHNKNIISVSNLLKLIDHLMRIYTKREIE